MIQTEWNDPHNGAMDYEEYARDAIGILRQNGSDTHADAIGRVLSRIAELEAALEAKHQQYTGAVIALTEALAVADRYQKADDAAVQLLEKAKLTLEVPAAEYVPAISDAWQLIENALEKIR